MPTGIFGLLWVAIGIPGYVYWNLKKRNADR